MASVSELAEHITGLAGGRPSVAGGVGGTGQSGAFDELTRLAAAARAGTRGPGPRSWSAWLPWCGGRPRGPPGGPAVSSWARCWTAMIYNRRRGPSSCV